MKQKKMKTRPFKNNETGFHKYAVIELANWTNGTMEQPFYIDDQIAFVPDVVTYKDGVIDRIYEVVHSHPIGGKKLGMMQYWSYRNQTELNVFEISSEFILKHTEKPAHIDSIEYYQINTNEPF